MNSAILNIYMKLKSINPFGTTVDADINNNVWAVAEVRVG